MDNPAGEEVKIPPVVPVSVTFIGEEEVQKGEPG
jgi:hypothetical protein